VSYLEFSLCKYYRGVHHRLLSTPASSDKFEWLLLRLHYRWAVEEWRSRHYYRLLSIVKWISEDEMSYVFPHVKFPRQGRWVTIPNIRLQLNQSNGICASLKQYKSGFTCSYKPSISVMRELLGSIRWLLQDWATTPFDRIPTRQYTSISQSRVTNRMLRQGSWWDQFRLPMLALVTSDSHNSDQILDPDSDHMPLRVASEG